MTPFETERLILRRWKTLDRPAFHRLNSDEQVMEFFPFRRDRKAADRRMDEFNEAIDGQGYGLFALERRTDGSLLGFTGLDQTDPEMPFGPGVEIGWRLLPEFWGKGYAREAATACLDKAFGVLGLDDVLATTVAVNTASVGLMSRLGFTLHRRYEDMSIDPAVHPRLVDNLLFRLRANEWRGLPTS